MTLRGLTSRSTWTDLISGLSKARFPGITLPAIEGTPPALVSARQGHGRQREP
jgi:hypothetical protein